MIEKLLLSPYEKEQKLVAKTYPTHLGMVAEKLCNPEQRVERTKQPFQETQMNQCNTCKTELNQPHFNNEPWKAEVQVQQSHILFWQIVWYSNVTSNQEHQLRHDNSIPCKFRWWIYGNKARPLRTETPDNKWTLQFS